MTDQSRPRLSPITPIKCPHPGCYWSVHGIPDQYTAARAEALADHVEEEHGSGSERPVDAGQADLWSRRAHLDALLLRLERGESAEVERWLLRAAVEVELAASDQAHAESVSYGREADRLRADYVRVAGERDMLRKERDVARSIAVGLEQEIAAIPELLARSYPDDYGARTILEHLTGEVAWPCETRNAVNPQEDQ